MYLFPYSYGFATRAPTGYDKLSFLALWVLPLYFVCRAPLVPFLLAASAQYALYELGYLQNDFVTTRREATPTFRLSADKRAAVQPVRILCARFVFFIVCLALLFFLSWGVKLHPMRFLLALGALALFFAAHNTLRSCANILTYFLLCATKYLALPLLFLPMSQALYAFSALFLAFVLPRSIEHAAKPRYGIAALRGLSPFRFRLVWGLGACLVGMVFFFGTREYLILLWFYIFRAAVCAADMVAGDPRTNN